jgi:cobaltochelatase CobT
MRGDGIRHTAAVTKLLSDHFTAVGARISLLGFTTFGWRGGEPRQQWQKAGRPERPGRLCALLHTVYQGFGQPLTERDWEVMLRPDMLRENIDGEALDWAYGLLKERSEPNKLLLILSDGASVDDSTLHENPSAYLERHLLSVISKIEADPSVRLAALGIGVEVSRYYRRSESAKEIAELPEALSGLITKTIAEMVQNQ